MRRAYAGRCVVITGAGGGLGRALALRFAREGARIAVLDIDAEGANATVASMRALGAEAIAVPCDVTDASACGVAMARVREAFGGVDVLVANAGITHRSAFADTAPEVLRRVMAVNYFGAMHATHAALPMLLERRGQLIAISSVAGFAPLIARTGYAASKHALHGFFESLRSEVAPQGMAITLVCPAFIATNIDRHALGADGQPARHAQHVIGTPATPEAIAERILRGAARERRLILPDWVSRLSWFAVRFVPRLYAALMTRRLRGELR